MLFVALVEMCYVSNLEPTLESLKPDMLSSRRVPF